MKIKNGLLLLVLVASFFGCAQSGSEAVKNGEPTAETPRPADDSESSEKQALPILNNQQIADVTERLQRSRLISSIERIEGPAKLRLIGTVLNEALTQIYPINWEKLSENEAQELVGYFFDQELKFKNRKY